MQDTPGLPFGPGSARRVDPLAEMERLAGKRKEGELLAVPRRDFAVLVALARRGAGYLEALPDGVTMGEAHAVLERYATC